MRELVYLSEAKLLQFAGTRKQRGRSLEGELKTPLGGFKIGRVADGVQSSAPSLDAVIAELEASPRAPKWFEDDSVQPGQWVHFESKLNYSVMPEESFSSAVLFLNSPAGERLLLHGSSTHLVGRRPPPTKVDLDGEQVFLNYGGSAGDWAYRAYSADQRANLHESAGLLGAESDESLDPFEEAIQAILGKLGRWSAATSAWMAGYARVTGILPATAKVRGRTVVATPLYVEYVDPPQD